MPTVARLAGEGSYGPLRSTIPAVTPTAWSSFLTGLNPAGHGIFNFSTNPNRGSHRMESAATRGGAPFWRALGAAGLRSAFVTVPFTYPAEPIDGIVVTGYGGPEPPEVLPASFRERAFAAHPDLVTARHPMAERWWEDFDRYTERLIEHVGQVADVCRLALEAEPNLSLLCVDFMSSDHAGHLGYDRYDPGHPAHDPTRAGDELVQVYEAVDRACGELIDAARETLGRGADRARPLRPRHEADLLVVPHEPLARGERPPALPRAARCSRCAAGASPTRRRSTSGSRARRAPTRAPSTASRCCRARPPTAPSRTSTSAPPAPTPSPPGARSTSARPPARCATGATPRRSPASSPTSATRETGERAFDVKRKEELFHGPFLDRAPELVLLPHDERIHVDSTRRRWAAAFERHERLDPEVSYGYSGHHGLTGILAAAGPGIAFGAAPENAEITQLPATICRLLGLELEGVDGAPIGEILAGEGEGRHVAAGPAPKRGRGARLLRRGGGRHPRAAPRPRLRVSRRRRPGPGP